MKKFLVKMKIGNETPSDTRVDAYSAESMKHEKGQSIGEHMDRDKERRELKRKRADLELLRQKERAECRIRSEELRVKASQPIPREEDGSISQPFPQKIIEHKRQLYVEDVESGVWPKQTNELCRWDLQPFTGTPIGIPRAWDKYESKFHLEGYFCSFSCAMAFLEEEAKFRSMSTARRGHIHLTKLAKDFYGDYFHQHKIRAAPPRSKLSYLYAKYLEEKYENPMKAAISHFRRDSESILVHPYPTPPFVRVTQAMDEQKLIEHNDKIHQERLALMNLAPQPISCTNRGMTEQRKYVLARRDKQKKSSGAIGNLLGISFMPRNE